MDQPVQLSSGLVEISALTAVVGSTTAESLILGNRGSAGVAWAAVSSFGIVSIIKACISAATPTVLREALGVRLPSVDDALGVILPLNPQRSHFAFWGPWETRARRSLGEAKMLICHRMPQSSQPSVCKLLYDVYVPGQYLLQAVSQLPSTGAGQPVQVHRFFMSANWKGPPESRDRVFLLLSLTKIIELSLLFRFGSPMIGIASSLPWACSIAMAVILQVRKIARGFEKSCPTGKIDILFGTIPTAYKGSDGARVLLDVPCNFRYHYLWLTIWAISSAVCVASLVLLYASLRQATPITIYLWLSFQLFWLFIRSALYQVLDATDTEYISSGPGKNMNEIKPGMDEHERVLDLLHAHIFYQERYPGRAGTDLKGPRELSRVLGIATFQAYSSFPAQSLPIDGGEANIAIHSIIGDVLLRSGAWLQGIKLCGIEPDQNEGIHSYDSAIVILSDGQHNLCAYPVVRSGCGPEQSQIAAAASPTATENGSAVTRQLYPRGAGSVVPISDTAGRHRWFYWLPCSDGRWLQLWWHADESPTARRVSITTDEEFARLLESQTLQIGEWSVEEAKKGVESSKTLFKALYQLLTGHDLLMN